MSENSEIAKKISTELAVPLKAAGFRKRANSFNRVTEDGIIHVISMQLGAYDPSGAHANFSTYRHGRFTVNLGVRVPEMTRRVGPRGTWTNEYSCQLRWRLGKLLSNDDVWWYLEDPAAAKVVTELVVQMGIPTLDLFSDRESILDFFFAAEERELREVMWAAAPLDVADLFISRGEVAKGETLLRECVADAAVNARPGHKQYLRDFLVSRGFEALAAPLD